MRGTCPICESDRLIRFFLRENAPVLQNVTFFEQREAESIARGDIDMHACQQCGFAFNRAFDINKLSYGGHYESDQQCSDVYDHHAREMVRHMLEDASVTDARIVEVGGGQGSFLTRLVEGASGNSGIGFDPSYRGETELANGRLRFVKDYFEMDGQQVPESADALVCRHVIGHLPEPIPLLRTLRESLDADGSLRLFIESNRLEWSLENTVVWDFSYEYCSYFSEIGVEATLIQAGYAVTSSMPVFNEQYMWIEATPAHAVQARPDPRPTLKLIETFAEKQQTVIDAYKQKVFEHGARGTLAIWGAGAKGMNFAETCDPHREHIDCVVDLNPAKHGCFVPGSGHPIVDYTTIPERGVDTIIMMNPIYLEESRQLAADAGIEVEFVS